jgi:WD40 repeat protein
MNLKLERRHRLAAVMAASLAAAGCSSTGTPPAGLPPASATATSAPADLHYSETVPTVSDGSSTVVIAGTPVDFHTAVTDASWSPDGSRLAFVDGDGNIATAHPDGTGLMVLTATDTKVRRAHPSWEDGGGELVFTERGADGVWRLKSIAASGADEIGAPAEDVQSGFGKPTKGMAPDAVAVPATTTRGLPISRLVFQRGTANAAQIFILDRNQRGNLPVSLGAGSAPVLSPDGVMLAYIGKGGQLYVERLPLSGKPKPAQVTFGVSGLANPAWSTDGSRIAFATATDVESVTVKLAPGAETNPTRVESAKPGQPAYQPIIGSLAVRLSGDPVADSVTLSRSRWATQKSDSGNAFPLNQIYASEVMLANADDPSAMPTISGRQQVAVLFYRGSTLDRRVKAEIGRVLGPSAGAGAIVLVGRTPAGVSSAVQALHYNMLKMAATDYLTPDPNIFAGSSAALVVSDHDSAAMANIASMHATVNPTVFLHGTVLTAADKTALASLASTGSGTSKRPVIYAVGPDAASALAGSWSGKSKLNIKHIADVADPVAESLALVEQYADGPTTVALVPAGAWQSQVLAGSVYGAVLLVDRNGNLAPGAADWLTKSAGSLDTVCVFGDAAAVPDTTVRSAADAVSGPAGYTAGRLPTMA